jgi:hypothetical protein
VCYFLYMQIYSVLHTQMPFIDKVIIYEFSDSPSQTVIPTKAKYFRFELRINESIEKKQIVLRVCIK